MFVVYKVHIKDREGPKYEKLKEFKTLEEANAYMEEQEVSDKISYTIMME